jgi:hypothetical protein
MSVGTGTGFALDGLTIVDGVLKAPIPTDTITIPQSPGNTLIERVRAPDDGAKLSRVTVRTVNGVSTSAAGAYTVDVEREQEPTFTADTTFLDSSPSAHTITTVGNATQDSSVAGVFTPVSGQFDGDNDKLTAPDSDDWYFDTQDHCIECWVKVTDANQTGVLVGSGSGGSNRWLFMLDTGELRYAAIGWVALDERSGTVVADTWFLARVERFGDAWFVWKDDSIVGSFYETAAIPDYATALTIGNDASNTLDFAGSMDDLRISKGIARGFPQLKPAWVDSSGVGHSGTHAVGGAYRSPVNPKFGDAFLRCQGKGGISVPDSDDFGFHDGDWTVDWWVRSEDITPAATSIMWNQRVTDDNLNCFINTSGQLRLRIKVATVDTAVLNGTTVLSDDTWHHIAIEKQGTTYRLYVDGVLDVSNTYATALPNIAAPLTLGYHSTASAPFTGDIDEFRISDNARYGGSGFTPPSAAYTSDANTKLLMHFDELASFLDDTGDHTVQWHGLAYGTFENRYRSLQGTTYAPALTGLTVASHSDFNPGSGNFRWQTRVEFKNAFINSDDLMVKSSQTVWGGSGGAVNQMSLFWSSSGPGRIRFVLTVAGVTEVNINSGR